MIEWMLWRLMRPFGGGRIPPPITDDRLDFASPDDRLDFASPDDRLDFRYTAFDAVDFE